MSKRAWIKVHCEKTLEMPEEGWTVSDIGVWKLLLCIAGDGPFGDIGMIAIDKKHGLQDEQIANKMKMSRRNWMRYKDKFVTAKMIIMGDNNVIVIKNWKKYQAKYTGNDVTPMSQANPTKPLQPLVACDKKSTNRTKNVTPTRARGFKSKSKSKSQKQTPDKSGTNTSVISDTADIEIDKKLQRQISLKIELLKRQNCDADKLAHNLVNNKATPEDLNTVLAAVIRYNPDKPIRYALRILDEIRQQRSAQASSNQSEADKEDIPSLEELAKKFKGEIDDEQ